MMFKYILVSLIAQAAFGSGTLIGARDASSEPTSSPTSKNTSTSPSMSTTSHTVPFPALNSSVTMPTSWLICDRGCEVGNTAPTCKFPCAASSPAPTSTDFVNGGTGTSVSAFPTSWDICTVTCGNFEMDQCLYPCLSSGGATATSSSSRSSSSSSKSTVTGTGTGTGNSTSTSTATGMPTAWNTCQIRCAKDGSTNTCDFPCVPSPKPSPTDDSAGSSIRFEYAISGIVGVGSALGMLLF